MQMTANVMCQLRPHLGGQLGRANMERRGAAVMGLRGIATKSEVINGKQAVPETKNEVVGRANKSFARSGTKSAGHRGKRLI